MGELASSLFSAEPLLYQTFARLSEVIAMMSSVFISSVVIVVMVVVIIKVIAISVNEAHLYLFILGNC